MTRLVHQPPPPAGAAGFYASVQAVTAALHSSSADRSTGPAAVRGSTATVPLTSVYHLPGLAPWSEGTTLTLGRYSGQWLVDWTPAAIAPGLTTGQKLTLSYSWAPRADILGAGGAPLTTGQPHVVVGVEGSRVKDPAQLTSVLVHAGATPTQVTAALAAATAHPTFFEPVFELTAAAYAALGGNTSQLHQIAGTVFQHLTERGAVTPGLAAHLVGSVGPVTAEQLHRLGPPYDATSTVGQSGLEAAYEKQLAGRAGGTISAVGPDGRMVRTVARFAPVAGTPVTTGVDPAVQSAAEAALAPVPGVSALVAVRVSTGQILASVSQPASSPFDSALNGAFPPGSTFKILTSTALFAGGLTPDSPASCPPSVIAGGASFRNAEGDQPVSDIAGAFTESCNTAFVQLATGHLHPSDFAAVASEYGLGTAPPMGYPAFGGRVPAPSDTAALAATAIGQAGVVVSPLDMAMVAADVAGGTVRPARLVAGAPADTAAGQPLPAATVTGLHRMMASVASSGTAAGTGLPAGTYAKTGTAQYGTGNPLPTDAWLVGWHGDVAFAALVQDSKGDGGPVCGPLVAHFLAALPPTAG